MSLTSSVKPKRDLKKKLKINKILSDLREELKDFSVPELQEMRLNSELLKHVCNLVESSIKKKYKPNKKEIVLNIFLKLIPSISEPDKKQLADNIEFLHSNGDIKQYTLLKKLGTFFFKSLKDKLLAKV
jgi:hypothetical protein